MISDAYRAQLAQLHSEKEDFGTSSPMYAPLIKSVIQKYQPEELLDVGCGKQALKAALGIKFGYRGYDPAIPGLDAIPEPADLTVCTDVMEHVESEYVLEVLDLLKRVTKKVGFFAIHTGPAMHILPDNRNAHITQRPARWWIPLICERFDIVACEVDKYGFWIIVTPIKE